MNGVWYTCISSVDQWACGTWCCKHMAEPSQGQHRYCCLRSTCLESTDSKSVAAGASRSQETNNNSRVNICQYEVLVSFMQAFHSDKILYIMKYCNWSKQCASFEVINADSCSGEWLGSPWGRARLGSVTFVLQPCKKQGASECIACCAEVSDIYLEAHPWTVSNGGLLDNLCLCRIMGHALEPYPYCALIYTGLIILSSKK